MTRIVIINHYGSTTGTGMGGRHHYFARELARKGHTVTLVAARSHHRHCQVVVSWSPCYRISDENAVIHAAP
ncbi:hypothetical protein ACGYK1_18380, partial [Sulfitobacter sp. 1A13191]|uniref:hypothetical protein n=1 Tax=Sulfitobacter sp. 1A13191 TaxID=3368589 RepID=UPI00374536B1